MTIAIAVLCTGTWLWAAYRPYDTEAWMLEQIATLICVALFVLITLGRRKRVEFSSTVLILLCGLFITHTVGTHFTYSLTPYDEFFERLTTFSLNEMFGWERNHYDRFVHFLWGLTIALAVFQLLRQRYRLSPPASWVLSLNIVLSTSAVYELMEWLAAIIVASEAGTAYLGTQGDIWDAQVDIALALVGGCVSWLIWGVRGFDGGIRD